MMKTLISLLLFAQMISTGNHRKIFTSAGSGITFVASAIGSGTGGTGTTSTSLNVTAGDKLIIFCQTNGSNNTISMSDTVGNTFSKGTHQNDGSIGNSDIFYAYSSGSNAADYFTCTNNNSASPNIVALQYRGGASSGSADALKNGASTGGSWITSSFSTTTGNAVVVQCLTSNVNAAVGPIGGITGTSRSTAAHYIPYCQDVIFSSIQTSITAQLNLPGTGAYNGQMVALP